MSRMEDSEKRRIVEALILSSSEPLSAAKIAEIVPYCDEGQAKDLVNGLNTEYAEQDRSFEIWEVAGGFQIRTRAEFSGYLQKLQKERALRLSQAALETLAIIAYRQPVTRAEIEEVRGVDAGATVKSLLERHLIRIAGQREVPGRPMLYGTTRRFLEVFGLERLKDLPTLRELDELAREQGLLEKTSDRVDFVPETIVEAGEESAAADAMPESSGDAIGEDLADGAEETIGEDLAEAAERVVEADRSEDAGDDENDVARSDSRANRGVEKVDRVVAHANDQVGYGQRHEDDEGALVNVHNSPLKIDSRLGETARCMDRDSPDRHQRSAVRRAGAGRRRSSPWRAGRTGGSRPVPASRPRSRRFVVPMRQLEPA